MPFTPKFVDMVRNLTTTTGTGAISLGSAVAGFTGIGAALTVGEQFYYCIQGIDKPAERETGRGTLLADGRIAREAISGGLTNFTVGTKTIALVTAAEWYAKVEAGGGGGGGGGGTTVATLADLAALPTANGAAAMLTANGREGLFVFDSANHAALVTADTRQGIYVAPASDIDGSSGAWVRRFDGPIEVNWFGTAADFVTDDLPAFDGALAVIKARISPAYAGGGSLHVRAGRYFLNGTLNVHVPVHLMGDGSSQGAGGTLLRFPNNTTGVVFNYGNTHGDGAGSQGDSTGSRMEGFQLWGGNVNVDGSGTVTTYFAGDSLTGHGVRIRTTFVTLRDIFAAFFGGDGFHINASNGGAPGVTGNANNFRIDDCQSIYNRGYAYLTAGLDANAGTFVNCSAITCSGGGFIEYSFLGNNYFGLHVRDCGVDTGAFDSPTGTCTYGGSNYRVMPGQEVSASTTQPGTNPAVWAATTAYANRPWVAGKTWSIGAPFATNPANENACNVLIGLYTEDNMIPAHMGSQGILLGGLNGNSGFGGVGAALRSARGGMQSGAFSTNDTGGSGKGAWIGNYSGVAGAGAASWTGHSDGTNQWELFSNAGGLFLNANGGAVFQTTSPTGAFPNSFTPRHLRLAGVDDINGGNRIAFSNAAPVAGTWGQGAVLFNSAPVAGGSPGWVCTASGTPGTWAALPPIGLIEASAAEVIAGASSTKFISPDKLFDAAAPVVLTDAATVTIDGATGINFNLTLGGNRTLANPTNMKPGQSGRIRVKQDATAGRTLGFGTNWLFAGGDPVLSTAANAIDVIAYFANSANEIEATIVKALS